MARTPCLISNITVTTVSNGVRYKGRVDRDGMEIDEQQMSSDYNGDRRIYFCSNCRQTFDGSETFDVVLKHLGTFPIDGLHSLSHNKNYEDDNLGKRPIKKEQQTYNH